MAHFDSLPIGPDDQNFLEAASKALNRVSGTTSTTSLWHRSWNVSCVCPWTAYVRSSAHYFESSWIGPDQSED